VELPAIPASAVFSHGFSHLRVISLAGRRKRANNSEVIRSVAHYGLERRFGPDSKLHSHGLTGNVLRKGSRHAKITMARNACTLNDDLIDTMRRNSTKPPHPRENCLNEEGS
jgi:hypothetical protein